MTLWSYRFFVMIVLFFAVAIVASLGLLIVVTIIRKAKMRRAEAAKPSKLLEMSEQREERP